MIGNRTGDQSFSMMTWFSMLSLACIALITIVSSIFLSRFLQINMIERDAVVMNEFIDSIVQVEKAASFFLEPGKEQNRPELEDFFFRIAHMPDVLLLNLYARDRTILWSSHTDLVGKRLAHNDELEEAFLGKPVTELWFAGNKEKAIHVFFEKPGESYVEYYIPVWDDAKKSVVGVIEIYKSPRALFEAVKKGNQLVWISAIAGGLFLYGTLFWIVRRGNNVIVQQRERLVEAETFATIGKMASIVAHTLRNPLASIRSSVELALEEDSPSSSRELLADVVAQTDRLGNWIRELLIYSHPREGELEKFQINDVVSDTVNAYSRQMKNQGVRLVLHTDENLPMVKGDATALGQVLNSVVANSLEAMPNQGELTVSVKRGPERNFAAITVSDTGRGISKDEIDRVFQPFVTTKRTGLGMGLPLAKRMAEHLGGSLELSSHDGRGTAATIHIPFSG